MCKIHSEIKMQNDNLEAYLKPWEGTHVRITWSAFSVPHLFNFYLFFDNDRTLFGKFMDREHK